MEKITVMISEEEVNKRIREIGWKWSNIFPDVLKLSHVSTFEPEKSKETLWKLYHESDSMSYRAVLLDRLLLLRLKHFEAEIAKSEEYPHEIDWDSFGTEMFDLLAMCEDTLGTLITESGIMAEFLKPDHIEELEKLKKYKEKLKNG